MCNYRNWYFEDGGYVVQCVSCNSFRVCFASTMLTLQEVDFRAFFDLVCNKKETHIPMNAAHTKCVVLATRCKSIHIILTETELNDLHDMLQEADTEMRTQQLIDLFSVTDD